MLSSMQGSLGIGANLNHWTAEDFATAKRLIAAYHSVQRTIVRGDLYRIISPRDSSQMSATETVSSDKNQAVVFAFANATTEGRGFPLLELQGLDPDAEYKLTWIEGKSELPVLRLRFSSDPSWGKEQLGELPFLNAWKGSAREDPEYLPDPSDVQWPFRAVPAQPILNRQS